MGMNQCLMQEKDWKFLRQKLEGDRQIYRLIFLVSYLSEGNAGGGKSELRAIMMAHRKMRLEEMGLEDYV